MVRVLFPAENEVAGLLGLMLLQDSRRGARVDGAGDLVTLEEQDRTLWNRDEIEEGQTLAETALRRGGAGFYALQSAIAALHAQAARAEDTDWRQIAALYALLLQQHPSPVVALNHAAAVAMGTGLEQGLRLIEAARGDRRAGRVSPAARREGGRVEAAGAEWRGGSSVRASAQPGEPPCRAALPGPASARSASLGQGPPFQMSMTHRQVPSGSRRHTVTYRPSSVRRAPLASGIVTWFRPVV